MRRKLLFPSLLLFLTLLSHLNTLSWFLRLWKSPTNGYCFLVPFIFAYLCWARRRTFRFENWETHWAGLLLLPLAFFVSLAGRLGSLETLLYLGLYLHLLSLGAFLYGRRLRQLAFPFLILLFAIPLPPFINRLLTFKLQLATSALSASLLRLLGLSVFREGNLLDLGTTQLQVAEACSGLRYFMPLLLIALLVGYYGLRSFWARALLALLVLPVSVLVNALRILVIALSENRGLHLWLEEPYHSLLGWLLFMAAAGLFLALTAALRGLERLFSPEAPSPEAPALIPSSPRPLPLLFFTALLLTGGLLLHLAPGTTPVPPKKPLAEFPLRIGACRGEPRFLSSRILQSLWADDYFYGVYLCPDYPGSLHLFIPYYRYQTARHTAHTPQSCLLGSGWDLLNARKILFAPRPTETVPLQLLRLREGEARLLALYFFWDRGRVVISPWKHKLYLLEDALLKRRTHGALVRLEVEVPPGTSWEEARAKMLAFLRDLWPYLEDYLPR